MRLRTGRPKRKAPSASDLLGFAAARLPYEKAALGERDRPIQQQRKCRKDQNAGKNGVDVEGAFRLQDEVAHAARRAQVLADHRADERESNRIVQARKHPAHRAWHVDVAQQLPVARAEDARIRHHGVAHFPHALVHVEEDNEEHQRDAERDLGPDIQSEPDGKDRRENHARQISVWSSMKRGVMRISATSRGRGRSIGNSPMGCDSGPAESTTTRSESEMASSRSWVMNSTDLRFADQSSSS